MRRQGLEVVHGVGGSTSGLAVPQFVIGAPGGRGIVPLAQYGDEINDDGVIFRNFPGQRFTVKQPKLRDGGGTSGFVPIEIAAKSSARRRSRLAGRGGGRRRGVNRKNYYC